MPRVYEAKCAEKRAYLSRPEPDKLLIDGKLVNI